MPWTPENRPDRTSNGHKWRKLAKAAVARDHGMCIVCGHGGAEAADHVIPVRERPDLEWEFSNLAAVHHKPCPVCSAAAIARGGRQVRCNYLKGYGTLETARRILHERTGLPVPGHTASGEAVEGDWW